MSQIVFAKVIRRLTNVYGAPNVPDQDMLYDEFCKALRGFSDPVLDLALDRVIRDRTFPTWPTVGEVVATAREAAAILTPKPKPEPDQVFQKKYVGPDRVKALLDGAMGQGLYGGNDYVAIAARCPIGGAVDVDAPWGEEVKDRNGNVVPIRQRKGRAA
jgi:hypothetical protein